MHFHIPPPELLVSLTKSIESFLEDNEAYIAHTTHTHIPQRSEMRSFDVSVDWRSPEQAVK